MAPRFGHDFGEVRIHTDAKAADSARAVGAQAYTVGRDVVFATGRYAPQTLAGKKLIAHELAHVLQQGHEKSVVRRAIHFDTPTPAREDPIPKVLRNVRNLGLTTPTINGIQLPNDFARAGQILTDALTPRAYRGLGSTPAGAECAFADFDVAVSASVVVPTRPVGTRWGPAYFPFEDLRGAGSAACQGKISVPVAMLGNPNAAAVADWIEANEQEHVSDLRRAVERYLRPYFNWLMSVRGRGKDANECTRDIQHNLGPDVSGATARGGWMDTMIAEFLRFWLAAVRGRDATGGHDVRTTSTVKGVCDRIEITAQKSH
jgi:hypothetical protein